MSCKFLANCPLNGAVPVKYIKIMSIGVVDLRSLLDPLHLHTVSSCRMAAPEQ